MAGRLQQEIKQRKPFRNLQAEAFLNLLKTAEVVGQGIDSIFRQHGVTRAQYNVLRILRGAEPDGLACREIGARMITHDSDITRLLDRLETRELVVRQREEKDRRVITTRITKAGLDVLNELDEPVDTRLTKMLGHLGILKLRTLIELLEQARSFAAKTP